MPDPPAVLARLARVLKDDGSIICTCPFFYQPHLLPYDFYRYTQYALRRLFEEARFEVEKLTWCEGYFATVGLPVRADARLPAAPGFAGTASAGSGGSWLRQVHLVRLGAFVLAGFFARLDLHWKYTKKGFPKNYVVIARRRRRGDLADRADARPAAAA